ncbi:MAG: DUF748 domain-containing protein [Bacteriovoracaceae bacterium]
MKIYKKKKFVIPLVIVLVLVAVRIVLEPVLLGQINKKLETFSPEITGHVADIDLAIFRGKVGLNNLTMKVKKAEKNFLELKNADVSLAWREIIKGNLMADAAIDGVVLRVNEHLPEVLKRAMPPEKKDEPKKQPPIRISRVDWKNVDILLSSNKAYTNEGPFTLSDIKGRITNLFASSDNPRSFFHVEGLGSGHSNFKAIGSTVLKADPLAWDVDFQMQGFKLKDMNRFLYKKVPLTFTKGTFDLYSEAKSEDGKIQGYVKPFLTNLDFIKSKEHFKNTKQWLVEVAGAIGNWIMEAHRDKTIATKVPFHYDGKNFSVDKSKAISNVIKHGFDQELSPGVDANLHIQAQEAKKEAKETDHDNKKKEEKKEKK